MEGNQGKGKNGDAMSMWIAESTASQSAALTPVVQEMASDTRTFAEFELTRSMSATDMKMLGNSPKFEALHDGYIRAVSAFYSEILTAGIITIVLTKNGVVIANTSLNMTINAAIPANVQRDMQTIAAHVDFAFSRGDFLGLKVETNGVITPERRELQANMQIYY